jgi:DNA-binding XRE family transcriptional regulator
MDIIKQLGPALRNSRIRLEITRDALASTAKVSPSTLSALENGHLEDLSLASAERICRAVGLELGLVLRGQAQPLLLPEVTRKRVRRSV